MNSTSLNSTETPRSGSTLVPAIVVAVLLVAAAAGAFWWKVSRPTLYAKVTHADVFPLHVEYKRPAVSLVGPPQTSDNIYVVAQVNIADAGDAPLYVKDVTGSLSAQDGSVYEANVIGMTDMPRLLAGFPKLREMVAAAGEPINLETKIPVEKHYTGSVVMLFPVPQQVWDGRKSAEVTVSFYHQDAVTLTIPKSS